MKDSTEAGESVATPPHPENRHLPEPAAAGASRARIWHRLLVERYPAGLFLPRELARRLWCQAWDIQPTSYRPLAFEELVDLGLLEPVGQAGWIVHPQRSAPAFVEAAPIPAEGAL